EKNEQGPPQVHPIDLVFLGMLYDARYSTQQSRYTKAKDNCEPTATSHAKILHSAPAIPTGSTLGARIITSRPVPSPGRATRHESLHVPPESHFLVARITFCYN